VISKEVLAQAVARQVEYPKLAGEPRFGRTLLQASFLG
jgi:hypothetical protein